MRVGQIVAVLGLTFGMWLSANASFAVRSDRACASSARETRKACVLACQEEFQVETDACRNVDHECAENCRTTRRVCLDLPLSVLRTCIQAANDARDAAIADCKTNHESGTTELDACIDAAQVAAFQARDTCREGINRVALKACRQAHRACLRLCPPAVP